VAQQPTDSVVAEFLVDTGWTHGNKVNAVSILKRFSAWLAGRGLTILEAGKVELVDWLDARRAAGKAPATVRADYRMLKAFYRWAVSRSSVGLRLSLILLTRPAHVHRPIWPMWNATTNSSGAGARSTRLSAQADAGVLTPGWADRDRPMWPIRRGESGA
jgi:hypothetical protein